MLIEARTRIHPIACVDCGRLTTRVFYSDIRRPHRRPYCADCARWVTEQLTPIAALVEAREIIHQHQMQIGGAL